MDKDKSGVVNASDMKVLLVAGFVSFGLRGVSAISSMSASVLVVVLGAAAVGGRDVGC